MNYILFFVYLVICSFLLTRIRFVKDAGISIRVLLGLFVIKVAAGCVHMLVALHSISDTTTYTTAGRAEYQLLLRHPKAYFLDLFQSGYAQQYAGVFQLHHSYWNDLKDNLIEKFLSVLDIFSMGNDFVNVVLYDFITFFGIIALFRVFDKLYPGRKNLLLICFFLLPSLLFFSSGIHKEGLIFAALGIVVFNTYYALNYRGAFFKRSAYITLALLFIFLMRSYVFIALLPALFAWVTAHKKQYYALPTFIIVYSISLIAFFNISKITPVLNPVKMITERRADFAQLPVANTQLPMNDLYPTFKNFVRNAPQALDHSMLRPYFSDYHLSRLMIPFAIELSVYGLLILAFFFIGFHSLLELPDAQRAVVLFGVFFSLTMFLMIGYTVPVLGAIVRYRAIYLPFILAPVLCGVYAGLIKKGYNKQLSRFFLSS